MMNPHFDQRKALRGYGLQPPAKHQKTQLILEELLGNCEGRRQPVKNTSIHVIPSRPSPRIIVLLKPPIWFFLILRIAFLHQSTQHLSFLIGTVCSRTIGDGILNQICQATTQLICQSGNRYPIMQDESTSKD